MPCATARASQPDQPRAILYLNQVLLLLLAAILFAAVPMRIYANAQIAEAQRGAWVASATGAVIAALVTILVATRSPVFGVDTATYLNLFGGYCLGQDVSGEGTSFMLSVTLLDAAMLGACQTRLLPLSWALLFVGMLLLAPSEPRQKAAFLGLLMLSLVGIELVTNALRQSLSVGAAIIAVALYPRSRLAALVAAGASVALHSSGALVLLAAWGATFGWPLFLLGMAAGIGIVAGALLSGNAFFLLEPLLYEIEKYLGHEADEIYVRAMAAACILVAIGAPLLAASGPQGRARLWRDPQYQVALRLGFTCIPFLAIPWFGFRYMYGVYPILLWLVLLAGFRQPGLMGRQFGWTLAGNLVVLLAWSLGSSYMLLVPFYA
jgi:hypothetical protein